MILSSWMDMQVLCPFYKDVRQCSIRCEGVIPDTFSVQTFLNPNEKKKQLRIFCCADFCHCEQYIAVTAAKYN